jgi:hypothetical protein
MDFFWISSVQACIGQYWRPRRGFTATLPYWAGPETEIQVKDDNAR